MTGDPAYNIHIVDSCGCILDSTVKNPILEYPKLNRHCVDEIFTDIENQYYIAKMECALKTMKPKVLTYHVNQTKFAAIIDPIDSETAYVHEMRIDGRNIKEAFKKLLRLI